MLLSTLSVLAAADSAEQTLGVPSTAFFGLLGVLIGAIIATVGDLALERVRSRHDDKRAERADRAKLVTAARLVDAELRSLILLLQVSEVRGEWWPTAYGAIPMNAFEVHKSLLAAGLTSSEWSDVADAYYRLGILELHFQQETNGRPRSFVGLAFADPDYAKRLGGQTVQLYIALRALREYAKPTDKAELATKSAKELHTGGLADVAERIGEKLPSYVEVPS